MSEPLDLDDLDPEEIEAIDFAGGRFFRDRDGRRFWVSDSREANGHIFRNASLGKVGDEKKLIRVVSFPRPDVILKVEGREVINKKSGFTVTDVDRKRKPKLPPKTIGVVKTERGWSVIQEGYRTELKKLQDPKYEEISKRRTHYNLRVKNRDDVAPRTLMVRSADLKKTSVTEMVESWKAQGGEVQVFTGQWSNHRTNKGKKI